MSKRAEQAALKAYPVKEAWEGNQYGSWGDVNTDCRAKYQEGYEQAEKDMIEKVTEWLEYAKENGMTFDGTIKYLRAIMEEEI